jgi:probable rRNA maturation factor
MFEIEIANSQSSLEIEESRVREIAETVLQREQVSEAVLSIALVDNKEIHRLNREYLQHDYETDVLSFLLECETVTPHSNGSTEQPLSDLAPTDPPLKGIGKKIEGEIIVSTEMAAQSSADYHWSPHDELVLYLVHGILHLCGYDDLEDSERKLMRIREQQILKEWDLSPHYDER